jgi:hypothetical protein
LREGPQGKDDGYSKIRPASQIFHDGLLRVFLKPPIGGGFTPTHNILRYLVFFMTPKKEVEG